MVSKIIVSSLGFLKFFDSCFKKEWLPDTVEVEIKLEDNVLWFPDISSNHLTLETNGNDIDMIVSMKRLRRLRAVLASIEEQPVTITFEENRWIGVSYIDI